MILPRRPDPEDLAWLGVGLALLALGFAALFVALTSMPASPCSTVLP